LVSRKPFTYIIVSMIKTTTVLKTDISETTLEEVTTSLISNNGLTVAICNANSLVQSVKQSQLREAINSLDIKTPDGFPVAKSLSFLTKKKFDRVDGFKVFHNTLQKSSNKKITHYFFGNTEKVVNKMILNITKQYPDLSLAGYTCPPILSVDELVEQYCDLFQNIDADIVWISLGLPKQELFMYKLSQKIKPKANLIGVGGVFDWTAGTKKKAPEWAANLGLEWILRLIQEPKRLAKRYFVDNFLFIYYFSKQVLSKSKSI